MKFELGQVVWYLDDNLVHSAPVLSRVLFQYKTSSLIPPIFNGLKGYGEEIYATCHGTYSGNKLFASKQELLESL